MKNCVGNCVEEGKQESEGPKKVVLTKRKVDFTQATNFFLRLPSFDFVNLQTRLSSLMSLAEMLASAGWR